MKKNKIILLALISTITAIIITFATSILFRYYSDLKADDSDIKLLYEKNKENYFKAPKSVKLKTITFGFLNESGNIDLNKKQEDRYKSIA